MRRARHDRAAAVEDAQRQHLEKLGPVVAALNSEPGRVILRFLEERFDRLEIATGSAEQSHARAAQRDVVLRLRQVRDLALAKEGAR